MLCGILFKTSYHAKTNKKKFEDTLQTLDHRGPDEEGFLFTNDYSFGHKRLSIRDITNGKQPMSILNHHLIYNGEIYNTDELKEELKEKPKSSGDTVCLLQGLIEQREKFIEKLNGIFAFVYTDSLGVLASRDQVGVKPLYYTILDGELIISSEIKAILALGVDPILGENELLELLVMAPSHTPGLTLYKNIYELKPGHYLTFDKTNGLKIYKYFDLKREKNVTDLDSLIDYTRYIVSDSLKRQLISDVGMSSLLSGGLDSSILSLLALKYKGNISTYSIDYENNDTDFKPNAFETSRDEDFINLLLDNKHINHKTVLIDTNTVFDYLKTGVITRDGPGMTDIDSSLFYLSKEISKNFKCAISGECADELFGGYPWFKNYKNIDTFPWIKNIEIKEAILNKDLKKKLDLRSYLKKRYEEAIKEVSYLEEDDELTRKELEMNYLNIKYFMPTLLDRNDRLSSMASIEVRVPFADKRIVNMAYNIPYHFKNYGGMEKALLRDSFKDLLPKEILMRKKSPYPKSQSKKWHNKIKSELLTVLNGDTDLYKIFNIEEIKRIVNDEKELDVPWFGQLMRKDALMAFIYQIHYWLKEYKIRVEI